MTGTGQIRYITQGEIDRSKWDHCISQAGNGLVYAYSFYLDAMAGVWDALVWNDYEIVMPLPWRKKWGVAYLYQPFLTAQLGVFGNQLSADRVGLFLKAIPKTFRYWDFPLNQRNLFAGTGFPLYERMNYVLPLDQPYEIIAKGYRENIRRNVRKSRDFGCTVVRDVSLDSIFSLTRFQSAPISNQETQSFKTLFAQLHRQGQGVTYGIAGKDGNLLASAAFLFSHQRAYYILVGNHPNGRTLGASHALIDAFIKDHADRDLLLDFEGSDIRNLAFFYSSFGAREEKYAAIRLNRLPWWAKWMK